MKLSVIVCAHNERDTIRQSIARLKQYPLTGWQREIIIVDNASTDGTKEIIQKLKGRSVKKIFHSFNLGKGASIKDGIAVASGDYIIIHDADLEYHPQDHRLLAKKARTKAVAIFGSRVLHPNFHYYYFHAYLGIRFLTTIINWLYDTHLTDIGTGMKMIKTNIAKNLELSSNGFELDFELTSKLLQKKIRIEEVGISYQPRSYAEGKKISIIDGLKGLCIILKDRFFLPRQQLS